MISNESGHLMPTYENGKKVLWWIIGLLTTIIIGIFMAYITLVRNVVTQEELTRELAPLNEKVDKLIREEEQQQEDLNVIKTDIAVLKLEVTSKGR